MKRYQLAIFDLDGTILDTLDDLADSVNDALHACGYPTLPEEEVKSYVGNGIRKLVERSVPKTCTREQMEETLSCFVDSYLKRCCCKTRPYSGISTLFDTLRHAGVQCAVVSNKIDSAVRILCDTYFPGQIDYCAGEKKGIPRKPAPDMIRGALRTLGVEEADAVYIGDSDVDITSAQNAGLPCISVTWGYRDRQFLLEHGAVLLADTVQSLADLILQA